MANADVVRQAYEAFNRKDLSSLSAKIDPDCRWEVPGPREEVPVAGSYEGISEISDYARKLMDAVDWQTFEPGDFIEEGDTVIVTGREKCVVKDTGRDYEGRWVHVFKMKGGRIAEACEFHDTARMAKAFH